MFAFSGWDLYEAAWYFSKTQGVNIFTECVFDCCLNACSGITKSDSDCRYEFCAVVCYRRFKPQMIKSYAVGDYNRMINLIYKASMYVPQYFYCYLRYHF